MAKKRSLAVVGNDTDLLVLLLHHLSPKHRAIFIQTASIILNIRFLQAHLAHELSSSLFFFMHFPRLAACGPDNMDLDTCVSVVASLREEFASCFADVKALAADFKLFTAPFDLPVDDASTPL